MKSYILLLGLTALTWPLFSQSITVSSEIGLKSENEYDILGKYEGNVLMIRDGINEFDIQAFDKDMILTWLVEETLDSRRSRIIDVIPHKNNFSVVYSDENKDSLIIQSRQYDQRARLIRTDTLKILKRGLIKPKFRYIKSEDRSKFLLAEIESDKITSGFVFDLLTRHVLWDAKFEFQEINFQEEYRKTILDNRGDMFLIFEKNNLRYKIQDHSMEIFKFNHRRQKFDFISVPLTEFTTYDAFMKFDNLNDQIVIAGLFSDKSRGTTDGIFFISVDANGFTDYQISTIEYNQELVSEFYGTFNSKRESLYNLDIQDIICRQDGGVLLFAEENKEYERLAYGSRRDYYGNSRYSVDYYYEDLILVSIHPDGRSHWQKLLPKRQYSNDDEALYSSYFLVKNPSYLRILYNDEIRSENTVSEYVVNGAGDISRRSLMSTDNQKLKLQIKNAVQVASNEIIMPSIRGKRLRLVRLLY